MLKDGTKLVFVDNGPLSQIIDRFGNRIALIRFGDPRGKIDVIRSQNGRWIKLDYDVATSTRIIKATDNSGRFVTYDYDANNRLWKVHDAAGGITEYGYDAAGRLRTIKDPRLITYLTVDYDANGRVQKQTQADSTFFQFAYTLANGKVTQTDVTDPRGYVRRVTFNGAGYGLSDTAALGQPEAQAVTYERRARAGDAQHLRPRWARADRDEPLWDTGRRDHHVHLRAHLGRDRERERSPQPHHHLWLRRPRESHLRDRSAAARHDLRAHWRGAARLGDERAPEDDLVRLPGGRSCLDQRPGWPRYESFLGRARTSDRGRRRAGQRHAQ